MSKIYSSPKTLEEVSAILADFRSSGLNRAEYCARHNYNLGTFQWWITRVRKKNSESAANAVSQSAFLALSPTATGIAHQDFSLDIEFNNGTRVRVRTKSSFSKISELLNGLSR
jgi:hypothetical protein